MDRHVALCYKCQKRNSPLLTCAMCNVIAHPACFLMDFPNADVVERRNWICKFCLVMDSDLIYHIKLKKKSIITEKEHKCSKNETIFKYLNLTQDLNNVKLLTSEAGVKKAASKIFLNIGGEIYAYAANYDLSKIFSSNSSTKHFPTDNTNGHLTIWNYEVIETEDNLSNLQNYFLIREEYFSSDESDEDEDDVAEDDKSVDGHVMPAKVADTEASSESFTESIEFSDYFYFDGNNTFTIPDTPAVISDGKKINGPSSLITEQKEAAKGIETETLPKVDLNDNKKGPPFQPQNQSRKAKLARPPDIIENVETSTSKSSEAVMQSENKSTYRNGSINQTEISKNVQIEPTQPSYNDVDNPARLPFFQDKLFSSYVTKF